MPEELGGQLCLPPSFVLDGDFHLEDKAAKYREM